MTGTSSDQPTKTTDDAIIERFVSAGQGHVFRFIDTLGASERRALLDQAAAVDLSLLAASFGADGSTDAVITPPGDELLTLRACAEDATERSAAREAGRDLLASGRVAVVVAAGGQGTRLGSDRPKALYPIGPRSGTSLLGWLAAKVRHASRRLGRNVPLVVMVSDATAVATRRFLDENDHFGLPRDTVFTPVQGSLPAIDASGRALLASRSRIAMSPNGHGGLYRALESGGLAERLAASGVTTLAYVQIDNPLVRPLDPLFLGHHALRGSRISSKSVAKTGPGEKVGVFGRVDGRPAIIEYSELSDEQAAATTPDGSLVYGQGSIAAHVIDLAFAREIARRGLPLHRAFKKVPHVDTSGAPVAPEAPNAYKLETFLFDAIPMAERSLVLETRRDEEFAPVKNATGTDSPESAGAALQAQFRRWFEHAGEPAPSAPIEVDPADAPDEDAFRAARGLAPWE